jgi:hypothetical protein
MSAILYTLKVSRTEIQFVVCYNLVLNAKSIFKTDDEAMFGFMFNIGVLWGMLCVV